MSTNDSGGTNTRQGGNTDDIEPALMVAGLALGVAALWKGYDTYRAHSNKSEAERLFEQANQLMSNTWWKLGEEDSRSDG